MPARVVLQDFTGVPCVVDLAAMRDAMAAMGGDPDRINPGGALRPGHRPLGPGGLTTAPPMRSGSTSRSSSSGTPSATSCCKFAQRAFDNFRVVPPGTGIVHQVNLEYLAPVVQLREQYGELTAYPDTLVGTDSHTTMINGLGVLGWGVGGIEAEAVMLGQPYFMLLPEVVGMKLIGELPLGTTATDLVLTVTQMLRKQGVVDKFVEFYGPGSRALGLADRATIANMAPEYGATIGFFPVDAETLRYLERTGRDPETCRARRALLQGAGPLPHRRDARPRVHLDARARPRDRRAEPGRPQAPAGPGAAHGQLERNFVVSLPGLMQRHRPRGAARSWPQARLAAGCNEGGASPSAHGAVATPRRRTPTRRRSCAAAQRRGHRPARRLRGDRRHHLLHQHVEPLGHDRRRPRSPRRPSSAGSRASPGSRPAWPRAHAW